MGVRPGNGARYRMPLYVPRERVKEVRRGYVGMDRDHRRRGLDRRGGARGVRAVDATEATRRKAAVGVRAGVRPDDEADGQPQEGGEGADWTQGTGRAVPPEVDLAGGPRALPERMAGRAGAVRRRARAGDRR